MAERKLKNRRRRFTKGKAIRVSDAVYAELDRGRGERSWDCLFRRMLGLPDRSGRPQPLVEGMLECISGMMVIKMPEVSWREVEETAHKMADSMSRKKRVRMTVPLRMRELR